MPVHSDGALRSLAQRVFGRPIAWIAATSAGAFLAELAKAAGAVAHGFRGEKISLRASALTYITMLSLVPLLAVAFAIVRAIGQENLRQSVNAFIYANLAPGTRENIATYLDAFIARASGSAMGGLGGAFLLLSAVSLLHNIEGSLNEIWGARRSRPLLQRALIYWTILSLGPVGLGISLAATATLRTFVETLGPIPSGLLTLVPWATTVLFMSFLYEISPNARVRLRPALGGGLVAGTAWEIAKHGYAAYAENAISYDAIYGSLGAIPLFLLWVYLSWLIFLFGARLAYALQTASGSEGLRFETPRGREMLCARLAVAATLGYFGEPQSPTVRRLSRQLKLDPSAVADAAAQLREGGLLAEGRGGALVPARAPEEIKLADISRVAGGCLFAAPQGQPSKDPIIRALGELFEEAEGKGREVLAKVDLASFARSVQPRPSEKGEIPSG